MATIADITVKKADGTTNVVWAALNGAAANSPAQWRNTSATGSMGQQPLFSLSGKWNAKSDVRRLDGKITYPSVYTETTTSLTKVRSAPALTFSIAVPQDIATADLNEFAAQATNLLASALIQSSIKSGFAPT